MKAYAQRLKGGPEVIEVMEFPKPVALGRDLLVKVIAVATNPVDIKLRTGKGLGPTDPSPYDPPKIVGYDAAGIVESVGERVKLFKAGDEVYFSGDGSRQGANAEYVLVDECIVARKPKTLTWEQAASVPLCSLTAWEALVEGAKIHAPAEGEPNPNQNITLLVIGGAGGVGSEVIQLAKRVLKIGKVIATASRPESTEWCKRLGADLVVNHENLKTQLTNAGVDTIDYVFVTTWFHSVFPTVVDVVKPTGTIIGIIGFGEEDLIECFRKSVTIIPEYMFARPFFKIEMEKLGEILNKYAAMLDMGVLRHTQNHHFEWHQLKEAHRLQESGKAIGKITLTVNFRNL